VVDDDWRAAKRVLEKRDNVERLQQLVLALHASPATSTARRFFTGRVSTGA